MITNLMKLAGTGALALTLMACGDSATNTVVEEGKAAWEVGKVASVCKQATAIDRSIFPVTDNTEEVEAYYAAHPDFFQFKTHADLPADLDWVDGMDLPELGSPLAKKGGTYNERLQDFPRTLRLVGPDGNGSFRAFILDYVRPRWARAHPGTKEFSLYPGIAQEWAVSLEDKKVYIRINPDARFSDGKPITADDALFTFFMMQSEYIIQPWYNDFYTNVLNGITKYDDLTFAISLPQASPDMAFKALDWDPYPRHFFKELGDDYPDRYQWQFVPTSGPYVVCPEDIRKGRMITTRRINDWWAKDKKFYRNRFNFDRMRFQVIRDTPKAFEAFRAGELDRFSLGLAEYWYDKLPDTDADVAAGYIHKSKFRNVHPRPSYGLWLNSSKPLLNNKDIRIGINYAANWGLVTKKFFRGDAERMRTTSDGYGPMSHPTLTARPFDVEKAMEHFARAGFDKRSANGILVNAAGQSLSLQLTTGYESLKDVLTILREEARKAGLDLRIEVLDGTAAWKKVQEKKHDIMLTAFATSYEMYPRFWETYHSDNAYDNAFLEDGSINPERKIMTQTNNLQMVANLELDAMINKYRASQDLAEMNALMMQMEELLYEDASFVPGFVQPFYRTGHHRWLRFPEGSFNELHTRNDIAAFVSWIDEDIKAETLAAKKSNQTFGAQINVYDRLNDD